MLKINEPRNVETGPARPVEKVAQEFDDLHYSIFSDLSSYEKIGPGTSINPEGEDQDLVKIEEKFRKLKKLYLELRAYPEAQAERRDHYLDALSTARKTILFLDKKNFLQAGNREPSSLRNMRSAINRKAATVHKEGIRTEIDGMISPQASEEDRFIAMEAVELEKCDVPEIEEAEYDIVPEDAPDSSIKRDALDIFFKYHFGKAGKLAAEYSYDNEDDYNDIM
ncbi:MAG: hypothetical protein ABH835_01980, partial [Patescibacteria group bacterium]